MKRNGKIYIVAGVVLAVVAGALLFFYLYTLPGRASSSVTPTPIPDVDVIVTTKDLAPGTLITGDVLKREQRKGNLVTSDMVREISEAVDLMVLSETKAGTVLKRGDLQAVPFVLPKGKRAMALFVDDLSSVAGLVRERDYVDIVVSGKIKLGSSLNRPGDEKDSKAAPQPQSKPQSAEEEEGDFSAVEPTADQTVVKAVLQRVQVLKVVAPAAPQAAGGRNQPVPEPTPVATGTPTAAQKAPAGRISNAQAIVVLAVTDQEAELLRYAKDTGGMHVLLRGRDDAEQEETKGMTLDILIRDYGFPVPKPVLVDLRPE
jgi:pilus assembly protein CpaB